MPRQFPRNIAMFGEMLQFAVCLKKRAKEDKIDEGDVG